MNAPAEIVELIKRFDSHRESYKSGQYNETQVRREFIDPLFTYLGWDVDNKQGYAESYKDVIHEDAIKVGGVTKAPDYCFRVGGTRNFLTGFSVKGQMVMIQMAVITALNRLCHMHIAKLN